MTAAGRSPEQVREAAYVVPGGTSELAWNIAAAWADVTVPELMRDTLPVRSTHYLAALRVTKVFSDWLLHEDAAAEAHAVAADIGWRAGEISGPIASDVIEDGSAADNEDQWARAMRLAEDVAALVASARDRGDAVTAAKYSSFENSLLQVAAGLQVASDIEKEVP